MPLQQPAYEGILSSPEPPDEEAAMASTGRIKRRPFGSNLRNRLNQIVSMYIPSSAENRMNDDRETTDHTGLLTLVDAQSDVPPGQTAGLYDIQLLYHGEQLLNAMVEMIGVASDLPPGNRRRITCISADQTHLYIGVEGLPYIFLLDQESKSGNTNVQGCIHLHVNGVGDICPVEVCVNSDGVKQPIMYIVGELPSSTDEELSSWVLVKMLVNGHQIARSPVYSYQRYAGLDVDGADGQLLLACPAMLSSNAENNDTESCQAIGQLCKLTPGFERRIFSITLGKENATYRPDWVARECVGQFCWLSVCRWPRSEQDGSKPAEADSHEKWRLRVNSSTGEVVGQLSRASRRLLAFPGRQLDGDIKRSPKEWLHVMSWEFADFNPGRIAAFDADRLLVLDVDNGSLSYITWPNTNETPVLHRVTRAGCNPISHVATPFIGGKSKQPVAFLVAGDSIYRFAFRDTAVAV